MRQRESFARELIFFEPRRKRELGMILSIFGPPSPTYCATRNIIKRIIETTSPEHATINSETLIDLQEKWQYIDRSVVKSVFFHSERPDSGLVNLMKNVKAPIVFIVEDFSSIAFFAMRHHGMNFQYACRFTTQVVCALSRVSDSANILRVSRRDYKSSLRSFVEKLIRFYGFSRSDEQFDAILAALASPDGSIPMTVQDYIEEHFPHADHEERMRSELTNTEQANLRQLETDYNVLILEQRFDRTTWPISLFCKEDGVYLDGPIECLGPARFLFFGPYLSLPEGKWRASLKVDLAECFSDNRIGVDIVLFPNRILNAISADLPKSGTFGFTLDFEIGEEIAPLEIRMQLLTGAIEGRISIDSIDFTRLE